MARPSSNSPAALPLACALVLAVSLGALAQPATPPADEARLRELERRAAERLTALQKEADGLARQQKGLLDQLRVLEVRRDLTAAEVAKVDAAQARAQAELARLTEQQAATREAIEALRPTIKARVVALYASGRPDGWQRWLASDDVVASIRASRLLAAVSARDQRQFARFRGLQAELAQRQTQAEQRQRELATLKTAAVAARDAASRAAAEHDALVKRVDAERDLTAQLAGELQTARDRLQQQVAGLVPPGDARSLLPIKPFKGDLPWPVAGHVVGGFGPRWSSRFRTSVTRNGIDIGAVPGTPVRAVHEGRVAFADVFTGYGRLVIVDHGGGTFTLYGYLDEVSVQRGAAVERGTALGTSGRPPDGQPAAYFELRIDGRPVNPLEWLKR